METSVILPKVAPPGMVMTLSFRIDVFINTSLTCVAVKYGKYPRIIAATPAAAGQAILVQEASP